MKTCTEWEREYKQVQAELVQVRMQLLEKESVIQSKDSLIDQLKEALILARNRQFAKTSEALRST